MTFELDELPSGSNRCPGCRKRLGVLMAEGNEGYSYCLHCGTIVHWKTYQPLPTDAEMVTADDCDVHIPFRHKKEHP